MGRIVGMAFFVGLLWLGVRVFTEGTDSVLSLLPGHAQTEQAQAAPPLEVLRDRGRAAMQQQLDRIEKQLGKDEPAQD
jgi:hypothetical protein